MNWKMTNFDATEDGNTRAEYEAHGYKVMVQTADYMPGGVQFTVTAPRNNRYAVDIYVDNNILDPVQSVRIQTTAWGAQDIDDIDKVIEAYKTAQILGREIEAAYPECFKVE